jgi:hypothetical protein
MDELRKETGKEATIALGIELDLIIHNAMD